MNLAPTPEMLTEQQLAERWQTSDRSIRRLVAAGDLRPVRIAPQIVRFRLTDVEAFEAAKQEAA